MARLEYVLSGIKRVEARAGPSPRSQLPITIGIMHHLRAVWLADPQNLDHIMLWAAACVFLFGFLRAGEFVVPSPQAYDPSVHLNLNDIAVNSHSAPTIIRVRIKQSKMDPFRQAVDVFLGATNSAICPVDAVIRYIAVYSCPYPGPLFVLQSGLPLTHSYFVGHLQSALQQAGLDQSRFNSHSFRIGATTTAAE